MIATIPRRQFLKQTAVLGTGLAAAAVTRPSRSQGAPASPADRIRVAVMGTNGRGLAHISHYLSIPNVEIAYVCDVDTRAVDKGLAAVAKKQEKKPQTAADVRRVLEDPNVDVLSIAAPNHWHAPAAILACAAGKHVYVEKPGSHNPHEGQLLVAAARRHRRIVQMGNQRRSWPWVQAAMQALHDGELGKLFFARTWYNNLRPSIGRGKVTPPPDWLDYRLWQGPAPERPYKDNLIHYNWHWHWHWGNGEIGNNGIHALDLARWGLKVDCPQKVACGGQRYHYQDDQETPDIYVTTFDFGDCGASWESHSCDPHGFEGTGFGVTFYGEKGAMVMAGNDCKILDLNNKLVRQIKSPHDDTDHFRNFLDCVRTGQRPHSEIEEGQRSTLLCHLGNIAYRTGRTLNLDPKSKTILGDDEAAQLWSRSYQPGWEPKV
jgi:predicted dehydrogenase